MILQLKESVKPARRAAVPGRLRIGWFGRMERKCVYLHAGARLGAEQLGLDAGEDTRPTAAFPVVMQALSATEMEDFLCIYNSQLARFRGGRDCDVRSISCPSCETSPQFSWTSDRNSWLRLRAEA